MGKKKKKSMHRFQNCFAPKQISPHFPLLMSAVEHPWEPLGFRSPSASCPAEAGNSVSAEWLNKQKHEGAYELFKHSRGPRPHAEVKKSGGVN